MTVVIQDQADKHTMCTNVQMREANEFKLPEKIFVFICIVHVEFNLLNCFLNCPALRQP